MNNKIFIGSIGLAGAFGIGISDFKKKIKEELEPKKHKIDTNILKKFIPASKMRRLDHFTRMVLLSFYLSKNQNNLSQEEYSKNTALILTSSFGAITTTFQFLDSFIDNSDNEASPTSFSNSVHNTALSYLSILTNFKGTCISLTNQTCSSLFEGLLTAKTLIETKQVKNVFLGYADEANEVLSSVSQGKYATQDLAFFMLLSSNNLFPMNAQIEICKQKTLPKKSFSQITSSKALSLWFAQTLSNNKQKNISCFEQTEEKNFNTIHLNFKKI